MGINNSLYNRSEFLEKVQELLNNYALSDWCIVSIDIERFKLFNNWYGQETGDQLLENISQYLLRIQQMKGYLAGHFGGDHFFMCIPDDDRLINLIYKTIRSYIALHSQNEGFLPVIGICSISDQHPDVATMCTNAQLAASEIKGNFNKRICYFTNEIMDQLEKEQQMLHDVKIGLENREFTFYLQPKCNSITGAIVSMEALSRWISPIRGFVSPGEFIPFLESKGMITALDTYVWDSVCQTLAYWKEEHLYVVPISINVSVTDLETINVPEFLQDLIHKYHLTPDMLLIEITETAFSENNILVRETIDQLHQYGFCILMDDFGSGYSSLNMLKDANIDILKLDMKFIEMNPDNRQKGIQIIDSIVNMAHRLKLPIIAEGVETSEQIEMLHSMNCIYMQGYFFYKPMPIADAEDLLTTVPHEKYEVMHKDTPTETTVSSAELLHETTVTHSIFKILAENSLVLARLNLNNGEYEILKRDYRLHGKGLELEHDFETYNQRILNEGLIHPEDKELYRTRITLDALRNIFFNGSKQLRYQFRRRLNTDYIVTVTEFLAGNKCDAQNPWIVVVIHETTS
ncbi:putative bifunctional diguanylate cyclase/phosphodiesterase [Blautia sp. MSJ-19]|uniref:putative bifunctional diguanylate cyclase/phosphodiesterase n=1 Tax=Blautia sp. MSJ-19 TaxID=2841517 RepID=UPI001C0F0269|nr:GGDEF domain-containing phosphodiesterase [Blautia sp. MSJ-19]MBU5481581.1 GGDEF domain-containing phosphodiesterase [Blautia sp. MSJ-19]